MALPLIIETNLFNSTILGSYALLDTLGGLMRQTTIIWIAVITLLPILSALAMQYDARRNSGTIFQEQAEQREVTFILNTADPKKAETTFKLARDLYNKGVRTTVILEGSGVTLVRIPYAKQFGYDGEIAVCPRCMATFGIRKDELPEGAYLAPDDKVFTIHAGDAMRPSFE
ncbi:hypothetical protein MKHDV_02798 [Halodesulfovibrio sp. MK-HDV]|jgi:predicted peroxiredoxin|nr:hypothetical protein MKHDV_02798 [Halodesulfovibrio sp. MK-HDV]